MQISKHSLDICKLNSCDQKFCIYIYPISSYAPKPWYKCYNPSSNTFTTQSFPSGRVVKKHFINRCSFLFLEYEADFPIFFCSKSQMNSQKASSQWHRQISGFGGMKQKPEVCPSVFTDYRFFWQPCWGLLVLMANAQSYTLFLPTECTLSINWCIRLQSMVLSLPNRPFTPSGS